MKVLSLFDGISCGRLALERAGIPVEKYYASEIDKYAIQISQKNYPDNIALGDVTKWRLWDIDWSSIDLLIGGSPCQTFSNAGTRTGFDGKSGLFYTYLEILNHLKLINPNIKFLLENVKMKSEWRDEITRCMGVEPVLINSALVSAQQRNRYYWCNWQVEQPQDKHIVLKDILLSGEAYKEKADCLTARYSGASFDHDYQRNQRTMVAEPVNLKTYCRDFGTKGKIMTIEDEKTQCLTSSMGTGGGNIPVVAEPIRVGHFGNGSQGQRIYSVRGKSICLSSAEGGGNQVWVKIDLPDGEYLVRKLSPIECERLQNIPDNYTKIGVKKWNYADVMDVKEKKKLILDIASYIIKDGKDTGQQNYQNEQNKNVSFVTEMLLQEDCVIGIIKIGNGIETQNIQIKLDKDITDMDIKNVKENIKSNTENLLQNISEEIYYHQKWYIILTLIKKIILERIYLFARKNNIQKFIINCNLSQANLLEMDLLSLKMESIVEISNTNRYKTLGNGWTVDVIAHIFSSMNQPKEEQLDLLDIC